MKTQEEKANDKENDKERRKIQENEMMVRKTKKTNKPINEENTGKQEEKSNKNK